jgi:hypothetical protein
MPAPNDNLLSDFAVYLNNWLMPFLTLGTVIALIITLDLQRKQLADQQEQFRLQQESKFFESYVSRFEIQYERYLKLIQKDFPQNTSSSSGLVFNLREFKHLNQNSSIHAHAQRMIAVVKHVSKNIDLHNIKNASDIERRIKFYIDEIDLEVEGAIDSLMAAFKYAKTHDSMILSDLARRALIMAVDMNIWGIYSDKKTENLVDQIQNTDFLNQ